MMIEMELFLGFPVDSCLAKRLSSISSSEYCRFLGPDSEYLTEVKGPSGVFLGKKVGCLIEKESLSLLESNIYSLLTKLAPDFHFKKCPLILFSLPK